MFITFCTRSSFYFTFASHLILTGTEEAEPDEEETEETFDKNSLDTSSQYDSAVQKGEEKHTDLVPPVTPSSEISRFSFCYLFVYVF